MKQSSGIYQKERKLAIRSLFWQNYIVAVRRIDELSTFGLLFFTLHISLLRFLVSSYSLNLILF